MKNKCVYKFLNLKFFVSLFVLSFFFSFTNLEKDVDNVFDVMKVPT